MDGVTEIFKDIEQGGGEDAGVQIFLQGHRTVGVAIHCVDMGGYPPHGTGPGGFPGPGGADNYRTRSGSTPRRRRREQRRGLSRWRLIFGKGRIQPRIIFLHGCLWTSVRQRRGIKGQGWGCGGGNRR